MRRALISWASCSRREESTNSSEMLGIWSIAASMPASEGSAAPRMSFTLRARLPSASSAIAWSSATTLPQSSCGPAERGGAVAATCPGAWPGCPKPENDPVGICAVGGSFVMVGMTGMVGLVGATGSGAGAGAATGAGVKDAGCAWRARWPPTISSTSSGGCLVASADLTSIMALGSSHRASARSGLSEMSRDSLV